MKVLDFLKDKIIFILFNIITFIVVSMFMFLGNINFVVIFNVFCIWFLPITIYFIIEFIKWRRYFNSIEYLLENLDKNIKDKKQLAFNISASNSSMRDDGIFYISANFTPDNSQKLEKTIFDEIQAIQLNGVTLEQVRLEISLDGLVPLHRTCRVLRRDASVQSHREVEQEVGIVSHTPVVQVHQLSQGLQLMVFAFVVEPARTDRDVAFAAEPVLLVLIAVCAVLVIADGGFGVVDAPLGCASPAVFIAYPANVRHGATKYHSRGMLGLDLLAGTFVIIIGLRFDRTLLVGSAIPAVAAVGSIEPEFKEGAVVGD